MKKILLLLTLILLSTGCVNKNTDYYENVADTAVHFFKDSTYNADAFDSKDLTALDEYLSTITHVGQIVDVSAFLDKSEEYKTSEPNNSELTVTDGKCYMKYDDIKKRFDEFYAANARPVIDAFIKVNCNGYKVILSESDFYPDYTDTQSNPRYDYVMLSRVKTKTGYYFIYKSNYDGSGLKLNIDIEKKTIKKIYTEFVNADNYLNN